MQTEDLLNLIKSIGNQTGAYEGLTYSLSDLLRNDSDQAFTGMTGNEASQLIRHILEQLAPDPDQTADVKTGMSNGDNPSASTAQGSGAELKSVLTSDDRAILNELLKGFPEAGGRQASVADGTVSLKDILTMIKEGLPLQKQDVAAALLSSSQYQKLLSEAFHEKWTLPQDKLSDKDSVTALYQNLQEDLNKLSELVRLSKDTSETLRLQEPVKNMQDNLEFLKNLNEVFTCLQLPVRFKEQDIHSDLYVFTKKDALKGRKESLNVLLHLDMPNLGPLNVHLHLDHNQVTAGFFPEESSAGRLISRYLPDLTEALQKKGYGFHAKVETAYVKPDFTKDFIEQNSVEHNITRYTFDIRT
jgi:hypothetical protein